MSTNPLKSTLTSLCPFHATQLTPTTINVNSVDDAGGVEKSRDRALTIEELAFTFKTFRNEADSFTRDNYLACSLLVLLGVRKGELTEAMWSKFDLNEKVWYLPQERSKSGVAIDIPLPDLAIEWLNELKVRAFGSDYVFPNRRTSKMPHMGKDTINIRPY